METVENRPGALQFLPFGVGINCGKTAGEIHRAVDRWPYLLYSRPPRRIPAAVRCIRCIFFVEKRIGHILRHFDFFG